MNLLAPSLRVSAAFILTLTLTHTASAEIYKWTDAQGNTHYTQTPPPAKEAKAEDVQNIGKDIEMATGKLGNVTAEENTDSSADQDEMAKAREDGKKNTIKHKTFCDQQKSALKQLLANPVIRWKSSEGERVLTAKERQSKIDEFNKNVKEMCNDEVLATKAKVKHK